MIGLVHKTLHLMQSYCFIGIKFESTIFQTAICLFLSVYVYMPTLWACRIQPYTTFEILDFYILPLELVRGWPWHILDPAFNLSARPPPDNADHTHAHTRPLANFLCRTIVDIPPVGSVSRWFIDRLNKLYCRHEVLQCPRVRNITGYVSIDLQLGSWPEYKVAFTDQSYGGLNDFQDEFLRTVGDYYHLTGNTQFLSQYWNQ